MAKKKKNKEQLPEGMSRPQAATSPLPLTG